MVNRERFNNAILDNGIVQSRGDFSIGLAETASLFAQQSPGVRCGAVIPAESSGSAWKALEERWLTDQKRG